VRSLLTVGVLCTLAFLAACDSDDAAAPSPTPTAEVMTTGTTTAALTPEATPPSSSGPRRTGDPALDAIIEIVEDADVDALLAVIRTREVECLGPEAQSEIGSPPSCEHEGVPPGTMLTVASAAECEGYLATNVRRLTESWLASQDGLYGVSPAGDGDQLTYHGALRGLNAGVGLWVEEGEITGLWFGCSQPASSIVVPEDLTAGPWPEPLTPRVDAVRMLVAPFLDAIEDGNAAPLLQASEHNFLAHGCTTSRDTAEVLRAFVESRPELVGIYEPPPRAWLDQWWLVFRLTSGDHVRMVVDVRPRIEALFQPCEATLASVTTGPSGDVVPLLWAP